MRSNLEIPYAAPNSGAPNFAADAPRVDRGELTPVISSNSALPEGTWQGLDATGAEQLLAPVALPHASPALNDLLNRILAEPATDPRLNAVRMTALLHGGQFQQAKQLHGQLQGDTSGSAGPAESAAVAPAKTKKFKRFK